MRTSTSAILHKEFVQEIVALSFTEAELEVLDLTRVRIDESEASENVQDRSVFYSDSVTRVHDWAHLPYTVGAMVKYFEKEMLEAKPGKVVPERRSPLRWNMGRIMTSIATLRHVSYLSWHGTLLFHARTKNRGGGTVRR